MPDSIADTAHGPARIHLAVLGTLSTVGWVFVALALPTSNRTDHVVLFLGVFATLFGLYFFASRVLAQATGASGEADFPSARRFRLLPIVFLFAIVFRLLAVLVGLPGERPFVHLVADLGGERVAYEPFLLYDNDLWRYLWDGHVLAQGVNPYELTPQQALEDERLEGVLLAEERWRDVHDSLSYTDYGTIYPPIVHWLFAALARLAPASVGAAKLTLVALDLLLCLLLTRILEAAGARRELVLLYAWNPAVIKEFSATGHPDVLMMLLLLTGVWFLVRRRAAAAGAALAFSVLAKLATAVAAPLFAAWAWRSAGRVFFLRAIAAGGLVTVFALFTVGGGLDDWARSLTVFAERWTFNSGPWSALRWLAHQMGASRADAFAHAITRTAIVACALGAAASVWRLPSPQDGSKAKNNEVVPLFRALFTTLAALVLLSPAVMPWYVLWALPAAIVAGNRWWPAFTGLAMLSYLSYADGVGVALWWKTLEYGALALLVGWDLFRRRGRLVDWSR